MAKKKPAQICLASFFTIQTILHERCGVEYEYLSTVTGVKKMKWVFVSHEVPFPATNECEAKTIQLSSQTSGHKTFEMFLGAMKSEW